MWCCDTAAARFRVIDPMRCFGIEQKEKNCHRVYNL